MSKSSGRSDTLRIRKNGDTWCADSNSATIPETSDSSSRSDSRSADGHDLNNRKESRVVEDASDDGELDLLYKKHSKPHNQYKCKSVTEIQEAVGTLLKWTPKTRSDSPVHKFFQQEGDNYTNKKSKCKFCDFNGTNGTRAGVLTGHILYDCPGIPRKTREEFKAPLKIFSNRVTPRKRPFARTKAVETLPKASAPSRSMRSTFPKGDSGSHLVSTSGTNGSASRTRRSNRSSTTVTINCAQAVPFKVKNEDGEFIDLAADDDQDVELQIKQKEVERNKSELALRQSELELLKLKERQVKKS